MKGTHEKIKLVLEITILFVLICFVYLFGEKFQPYLECPENKIYPWKEVEKVFKYLVKNTGSAQNSKWEVS